MSGSRPPEDGANEGGEAFVDLGGESGFLTAIPDDGESIAPPRDSTSAGASSPPSAAAATPFTGTHRAAPLPVDTPAHRDRIVILGRRASGKTVYLARLYHHLFRGADGLSMEALDGPSHLRCVKAMDELVRGQWPAATGETSALDLDLRFPGGAERLVVLDYPGEVFRRAFLEDVASPDVATLLEHVDRAAAVIMLIDPATGLSGRPGDSAEDDFGMIQALKRIRSSPRGGDVPVALVLTKVDAHAAPLRAAGGLKPFVEKHYPALVRAAPGARVFGCAAARMVMDPMGRRLPQVRGEPVGVVEPLAWCLVRMGKLRRGEAAETRRRDLERAASEAQRDVEEELRRERRVLVFLWSTVAIILVVGGFIVWYVVTQPSAATTAPPTPPPPPPATTPPAAPPPGGNP